jgi:hypothetical protein
MINFVLLKQIFNIFPLDNTTRRDVRFEVKKRREKSLGHGGKEDIDNLSQKMMIFLLWLNA